VPRNSSLRAVTVGVERIIAMLDIAMVAIALVFFALSVGYAVACDRL
jgi:hypothetical protein